MSKVFSFYIRASDDYGNEVSSELINIKVEPEYEAVDPTSFPWNPMFEDELENQNFTIAYQNDTNEFSFSLPKRTDANGDDVSLKIESESFGNISTAE